MKIREARLGLRVKDEFLGEGLIVDTLRGMSAVMVRFDKWPPFDYNCGNNPCLRFVETMEPIESAGAAREERGG